MGVVTKGTQRGGLLNLSIFLMVLFGLVLLASAQKDQKAPAPSPQANSVNATAHEEPTPVENEEEEEDDTNKADESPFVHVLTDATFDSSFNTTHHWLVEFYAPWCGHCQELFPKFNEAAKNNKNPNVKFGKVDATVNRNLSDRYKIKGYPTLIWFSLKDGVITTTPYNYQREVQYLNAFVREQMNQRVEEVATLSELSNLQPHENSILLIVSNKAHATHPKNTETIHKTSIRAGKEGVYQTNSAEIRQHFGIPDVNTNFVVDYTIKSNGRVIFTYHDTEINAEDYIRSYLKGRSPVLGLATESSVTEVLDGPIKAAFVIYGNSTDSYVNETLANARNALEKHESLFYSLHSGNGTLTQIANIVEALRIQPEDYPVFIILDPPAGMGKKDDFLKYKLSGNGNPLKEDEVTKFIEDYTNGKVANILSSDPIPERRIYNGVETVVGLSIKEFANYPGRDSLLAICTSFSVKCRSFNVILERLSKRLSNTTLAIGHIDFNNNEYEHIVTDQIPTVLLFKDNADKSERYRKESIVYYNGTEFTSDSLIEFVRANAFNKVELVNEELDDHPENHNHTMSHDKYVEEMLAYERSLNVTRISMEDDSDYKTDDELKEAESEKDKAKREAMEEEERKQERIKKEIEEEEPDLQEPEPELPLHEQLEEAKRGGMDQTRVKKEKVKSDL